MQFLLNKPEFYLTFSDIIGKAISSDRQMKEYTHEFVPEYSMRVSIRKQQQHMNICFQK